MGVYLPSGKAAVLTLNDLLRFGLAALFFHSAENKVSQ